MKHILDICDNDIFPANYDFALDLEKPALPEERKAVRIIILDEDDNIAVVGRNYENDNVFRGILPGGGVENGETYEIAAIREAIEETGCHIEPVFTVGYTNENRKVIKRKQTTYCIVARVVGEKGLPQTTQKDEIGLETKWFSLDEIIVFFENQIKEIPFKKYHTQFNIRTNLAFLKEYRNILTK
jgi:ADP-ribose pyrophosphatase